MPFVVDPNFNVSPYTLIYDEPVTGLVENAKFTATLVSVVDTQNIRFSPDIAEQTKLDYSIISINSVTWPSSLDSSPFFEIDNTQISTITITNKFYLVLSSNTVLSLSDLGASFYRFQDSSSTGLEFIIDYSQIK